MLPQFGCGAGKAETRVEDRNYINMASALSELSAYFRANDKSKWNIMETE